MGKKSAKTWKKVKDDGASLPENAVVGGIDENGDPLFVGRGAFQGGIIPGSVTQSTSMCEVPYGSNCVWLEKFQVLTNPKNLDFIWVSASNGHVPTGAIVGGVDPYGEAYYIGRFHHSGAVKIGKVHRSHGVCYIGHGEEEVSSPYYEVLTMNTVRLDDRQGDADHGSSSSSSSSSDDE